MTAPTVPFSYTDLEALLRAARPEPETSLHLCLVSAEQIRTGHLRRGSHNGLITRARTFRDDVACRFCTAPGLLARVRRAGYVLAHRDPHAAVLAWQDHTDRHQTAVLIAVQQRLTGLTAGAPPACPEHTGPAPVLLPTRRHTARPPGGCGPTAPGRCEQVTPRIGGTGPCAGCPDLIVYDDVTGWTHTGTPTAALERNQPA